MARSISFHAQCAQAVEEDKVDLLIGTSGLPGSVAMAAVAGEQKVPFVSISPLPPSAGKVRAASGRFLYRSRRR